MAPKSPLRISALRLSWNAEAVHIERTATLVTTKSKKLIYCAFGDPYQAPDQNSR